MSKIEMDQLGLENPEAMLADGFESAFLGVCRRFGQDSLAAYDYDKCIEILATNMTHEEAVEFFDFNVIGAWVGDGTPVFISLSSGAKDGQ